MKTPDAIVVLAGGIKQDTSGRWVSTDLSAEDDALGAPGGKLRVLAAAVLATMYPTAIVILSGGEGYDVPKGIPEDRPSLAKILRDELVESGVSADRIVLEENSNTTYQQLQELEVQIKEQGWQSVMVITNSYHHERVVAMIEAKFTQLKEGANFNLVSAETVLVTNDSKRWRSLLEKEYKSAYMQERENKEKLGIEQIHSGVYQFR